MAWATDLSEITDLREEIWGNYSVEGGYGQDIVINQKSDDIVFFGKVMDSEKKGVPGVIVNISACMEDGTEVPLACAYSGGGGNYLLSVKKPQTAAAKYIVRAGSGPW